MTHVLGLQVRLKRFTGIKATQDAQLLSVVWLGMGAFEAGLQPATLFRVLNLHVFHADGAAVGIAQERQDVTQGRDGYATKTTGSKFTIEVPHGQAVCSKVQIYELTLFVFERVRVGHEVSAHAVGVDQFLDASSFVDVIFV
ncbi:unannotated protein [freshwater metagenome]|uniref:Unannotated protein n=1 Tax=freshwater metagenome TaxID=449393 RepID=A0A6J6B6Z6_9ZZZZ